MPRRAREGEGVRVTYRVSPGQPGGILVAGFLLHPSRDRELREAFGPDAWLVLTAEVPREPTEAELRALAPEAGQLVAIGYSLGCMPLRHLLRSGVDLAAVVAIDGTHGSWPRREPWQISTWRDYAARARRGEVLFVATHTYQTYTEQLRAPDVPFASTVTVLREVTGWPLPMPATSSATVDGGLVVASYASARIDGPAHVRQATEVLGAVLRKYVAPQVAKLRKSQIEPSFEVEKEEVMPKISFCEALIAAARTDLDVREAGANTGPRVDAMLRAVGVSPPANWCAAAVSSWLRAAAKASGLASPIAGSPGAKALGEQMRQAGRWVDVAGLAGHVGPGWIVVWHRGVPGAWTGHVGIVERVEGDVLHTIEGNSGPSGDRVARMERRIDDPLLLGGGRPG